MTDAEEATPMTGMNERLAKNFRETWPAFQGPVDLTRINTEVYRVGWPTPTLYREHEAIHVLANVLDKALGRIEELEDILASGAVRPADERWNTAVDWLLNAVDENDFVAPFWAFYDGIITEDELRSESVFAGEINARRAALAEEGRDRG